MEKIAIIGSGTMGNGIAHTFAQFGYSVGLIDIDINVLQKGLNTIAVNIDRQIAKGILKKEEKKQILENIITFTNLKAGVEHADIIIEAATENTGIKLKIFEELSDFCKPEAILASNTSSISITKIASVTQHPENVIGMHFMNPVPLMKLVEIISGYRTSKAVNRKITDLTEKLQKQPVHVADYPGFVANRILMPMINEAIYTVYEGVAGVDEVDKVMKLGMAHPMGPLQLADFIGLDVCLAILHVLYDGFKNPKYAPCPLLVNMVTAGHIGRKSKIGFYDYTYEGKNLVVAQRN